MLIDCEQGVDCLLGSGQCEACRLNELEQGIESAMLRAERDAERDEEEEHTLA